jgi:hypothetical protein
MKFSMTRQKMWPFNTGDCLIEVTTWPGFTDHNLKNKSKFQAKTIFKWKKYDFLDVYYYNKHEIHCMKKRKCTIYSWKHIKLRK